MNSAGKTRVGVTGLVVVGFFVCLSTPVRAVDRIEEKLLAEALNVIDYLKKNKIQNVGVLKFRVQKGNQPESFSVGPLNVIMAIRLENALILQNDDDKPIGIIRDAGKVIAGQKEKITYLTDEGCAKLFKFKYPLAWGTKEVRADAFLTGVVRISPDKSSTTVVIEAIEPNRAKRKEVTSFVVKTERTILSDLCNNFVLDSRTMRTAAPDDTEAVHDSHRRESTGGSALSNNRLVELKVYYSGNPQTIAPHSEKAGEEDVAEPQAGQSVIFTLKSKARVGVILAVNGKNTLYREDLAAVPLPEATRWILEPNIEYKIRGFYDRDDKTVVPFAVQSESASEAEEILNPSSRLGAIELFVFVQGKENNVSEKPSGLRKPLSSTDKALPKDAKEATDLVQNVTRGEMKTAGYIQSNGSTEKAKLLTGEFPNPQLQESRIIWYKERKSPAKSGGK